MHLFRIWFQRLPDIRNFAVYFLALWPMFQLIPTLRENSCTKPVLRANLWVKFRYSRIEFFWSFWTRLVVQSLTLNKVLLDLFGGAIFILYLHLAYLWYDLYP